jgi:hypothetical protein
MPTGYIKGNEPPEAKLIIDLTQNIMKWNLVIHPNKCFESLTDETTYNYKLYAIKKLVNIDLKTIIGTTDISTSDADDNNSIISMHNNNIITLESTSDVIATLKMDDNYVTSLGGNYGLYIYPLSITIRSGYETMYNLHIEFERAITPFVNMSNLDSYKTFYFKIIED